jgi:hypothetical protein
MIPPCLLAAVLPLGGLVAGVLGAAVPLGAVGVRGTPTFAPLGGGLSGPAPPGTADPGTGGASRLSPGAPKPIGLGSFPVVS